MKKVLIILPFFCFLHSATYSQTESIPEIDPYFSAIIVTDLESSVSWYSMVLGFNVTDQFESKERGFKIANLKRSSMAIELLEIKNAVHPESIIPDYSSKTKIVGFFKIGYRVADFEGMVDHLMKKDVEFYGNIVKGPNTGKRMVIITDPDGHRIQIFEK